MTIDLERIDILIYKHKSKCIFKLKNANKMQINRKKKKIKFITWQTKNNFQK